jgi:hypothetical protein
MDNLKIPEYIEPEIVETTFMATKEETFLIWVATYGEKEAREKWIKCFGTEPFPNEENKAA